MGCIIRPSTSGPEEIDEDSYNYYVEEEGYEGVYVAYYTVGRTFADIESNILVDMTPELGEKIMSVIHDEVSGMSYGQDFIYYVINSLRRTVYQIIAVNSTYEEMN